MLITFCIIGVVALVILGVQQKNQEIATLTVLNDSLKTTIDRFLIRVHELEEQAEVRNQYLDYVFQHYGLHKANPYMAFPNYEENRCCHCFYPVYAGHEPSCPWIHCRPITEALYPVPVVPVASPDPVPDGNTIILPAAPENSDSDTTTDMSSNQDTVTTSQ